MLFNVCARHTDSRDVPVCQLPNCFGTLSPRLPYTQIHIAYVPCLLICILPPAHLRCRACLCLPFSVRAGARSSLSAPIIPYPYPYIFAVCLWSLCLSKSSTSSSLWLHILCFEHTTDQIPEQNTLSQSHSPIEITDASRLNSDPNASCTNPEGLKNPFLLA